jgi:hypothetical protein
LLILTRPSGQAQNSNFNCDVASTEPVVFEQNSLFCVGEEGNISARDRAIVVAGRMQNFLTTSLPVDRIRRIERLDGPMSVLAYNTDQGSEAVILTVTNLDASNINPDRQQLADTFLQEIKRAIRDAQAKINPPNPALNFGPRTQGRIGDPGNPTDVLDQPAQAQPESAAGWQRYVWVPLLSLLGLLLLGLLLGSVPMFENAIAGLLLRNRVKPGNQIMLNHEVGTIQTISLLSTKLLAEDEVTMTVVPNSMLLKQPIKLSSTTQLTNPETAANQTGLLRFKVQSDSQVVTRQLEKALKFEVERMRRIRWQALELIATDGQTLTNNYELQLVRQLGLFSQKHENACRKIAQRLQQQCDRAGIDASVQPIST